MAIALATLVLASNAQHSASSRAEPDSPAPIVPTDDSNRPVIERFDGYDCNPDNRTEVAYFSGDDQEDVCIPALYTNGSSVAYCDTNGNLVQESYSGSKTCTLGANQIANVLTYTAGVCVNEPPYRGDGGEGTSYIYRCKKSQVGSAFKTLPVRSPPAPSFPRLSARNNCFPNATGCGLDSPTIFFYNSTNCDQSTILSTAMDGRSFPTGQCFFKPHPVDAHGDVYVTATCSAQSYSRITLYGDCYMGATILHRDVVLLGSNYLETCQLDASGPEVYSTFFTCNQAPTPRSNPTPTPQSSSARLGLGLLAPALALILALL